MGVEKWGKKKKRLKKSIATASLVTLPEKLPTEHGD
jgi:hypothetical protein